MNEPINMAAEVFQVKEGVAEFRHPADLSPESRKDIVDWLKLVLRKLKRQSERK